MPFAVVIRSGTMPSCSHANQAPVRQKPVWISSAMNRMPCSRRELDHARQEPVGRDDEAALALDRLDQHRRDVMRTDLRVDDVLQPRRASAAHAVSSPSSRNG